MHHCQYIYNLEELAVSHLITTKLNHMKRTDAGRIIWRYHIPPPFIAENMMRNKLDIQFSRLVLFDKK